MSRLQRLELEALKESYKELSKRLDDLEGGVKSQPKKPETLKVLDHSVFNGLDEKWRFAAVDKNGTAYKFTNMPDPREKYEQFMYDDTVSGNEHEIIAEGYDASNWKNSLIKRESKELTGSDLARAMLRRGDKIVMCAVSDDSQDDTLLDGYYSAIQAAVSGLEFYDGRSDYWQYATPVNNMGEPLTAADVGL